MAAFLQHIHVCVSHVRCLDSEWTTIGVILDQEKSRTLSSSARMLRPSRPCSFATVPFRGLGRHSRTVVHIYNSTVAGLPRRRLILRRTRPERLSCPDARVSEAYFPVQPYQGPFSGTVCQKWHLRYLVHLWAWKLSATCSVTMCSGAFGCTRDFALAVEMLLFISTRGLHALYGVAQELFAHHARYYCDIRPHDFVIVY